MCYCKINPLFRLFFKLTFGGTVAVFLPLGLLWLLELSGWITLDAVFDVALSPLFLVGSTLLAVLALWYGSRSKPETSGYSAITTLLPFASSGNLYNF